MLLLISKANPVATIILSCYVNNAILPVTVSFLNAPDGFNPLSYNASHPLFNTLSFSYGSNTNPLPTGTYTIKFTDFLRAYGYAQY